MIPVEDVSGGPCGWCRDTHPVDAPHVTDPHTPTEEETPGMSDLPAITADPNDWDWMEIVAFDNAIESEGYDYAFDHYKPLFRRPELRAIEDDMGRLRDFWHAHTEAVEAWGEEIGWDAYGDLYEAHLPKHREEKANRRSAS